MHYTAVVIFNIKPSVLCKFKDGLSHKSKHYFEKEYLKAIAGLGKIDMSDKINLVRKLKEYTQEEVGIDEKGIYGITEVYKNKSISLLSKKLEKPFARLKHFDHWNAFDLMTTKDLLSCLGKIDRFPHAIFTPDCKWVEAPEYFMFINASSSNYQAYLRWEERVKKILEQYSGNSTALLINCHV